MYEQQEQKKSNIFVKKQPVVGKYAMKGSVVSKNDKTSDGKM